MAELTAVELVVSKVVNSVVGKEYLLVAMKVEQMEDLKAEMLAG